VALFDWTAEMRKSSRCVVICVLLFQLTACNKHHEPAPQPVSDYSQVSIMTYNGLYSTSNEQTLHVLRETGADIIGMQETSVSRLMYLAQALHYHYYSFPKSSANLNGQDTGILTRFPISRFLDNGVVVNVNPSLQVAVFTVHLSPYPYQPYDFRDGKITTSAQAVSSAAAQRLPEIQPVLDEVGTLQNEGIPVFLTGDFNEPSHLDWTAETAGKNLHFGKIVEWPVSKAIYQTKFTDVYRSQFPNPANFPGNTWTTLEGANEVYDRIDMIYQTEDQHMTLNDVRLVGGEDDYAGVTVKGYASDHYAVIATYKLKQ
jgi:exonuclease III